MIFKLSKDYPYLVNIVEDIVLIGGAATFTNLKKWEEILKIVGGRIINCHGEHDKILKHLYVNSVNKTPIGLQPIKINLPFLFNEDFSEMQIGHLDYRTHLREIFSRINIFY